MAMVRDYRYRTFATILTPLRSHFLLPLNLLVMTFKSRGPGGGGGQGNCCLTENHRFSLIFIEQRHIGRRMEKNDLLHF